MFFRRPNGNFGVQYKTFHLQLFALSMHWAVTQTELQTTKTDKACSCNKNIMGIYTSRPKNRKFGKFPQSRAQAAGDRKVLWLNRKIAVQPPEKWFLVQTLWLVLTTTLNWTHRVFAAHIDPSLTELPLLTSDWYALTAYYVFYFIRVND